MKKNSCTLCWLSIRVSDTYHLPNGSPVCWPCMKKETTKNSNLTESHTDPNIQAMRDFIASRKQNHLDWSNLPDWDTIDFT